MMRQQREGREGVRPWEKRGDEGEEWQIEGERARFTGVGGHASTVQSCDEEHMHACIKAFMLGQRAATGCSTALGAVT